MSCAPGGNADRREKTPFQLHPPRGHVHRKDPWRVLLWLCRGSRVVGLADGAALQTRARGGGQLGHLRRTSESRAAAGSALREEPPKARPRVGRDDSDTKSGAAGPGPRLAREESAPAAGPPPPPTPPPPWGKSHGDEPGPRICRLGPADSDHLRDSNPPSAAVHPSRCPTPAGIQCLGPPSRRSGSAGLPSRRCSSGPADPARLAWADGGCT